MEAETLQPDELTECEEARDLPPDVAKMIRVTAAHLERLDAHALIGVERDAEWNEVERAYRTRLATFHPSRWSGYDLAELRPSMEGITERLSAAFAALAADLDEYEAGDDRSTSPAFDDIDMELSGERPTFPSHLGIEVIDTNKARPPRPPPRR
jgi:hypothetical protein